MRCRTKVKAPWTDEINGIQSIVQIHPQPSLIHGESRLLRGVVLEVTVEDQIHGSAKGGIWSRVLVDIHPSRDFNLPP